MREIIVKFNVYDEDEERLTRITEEYNKRGVTLTEEQIFEAIMTLGSKHDIDRKLKFHECNLKLGERE